MKQYEVKNMFIKDLGSLPARGKGRGGLRNNPKATEVKSVARTVIRISGDPTSSYYAVLRDEDIAELKSKQAASIDK